MKTNIKKCTEFNNFRKHFLILYDIEQNLFNHWPNSCVFFYDNAFKIISRKHFFAQRNLFKNLSFISSFFSPSFSSISVNLISFSHTFFLSFYLSLSLFPFCLFFSSLALSIFPLYLSYFFFIFLFHSLSLSSSFSF